jgi:hypothetical protein
LKAQVADEKDHVIKEIGAINTVARNTISELQQDLGNRVRDELEEVVRLKREAFELGKEFGQFQAMRKTNEWLEGLLSLVEGGDQITVCQVRVIGLMLLKGISAWLDRNRRNDVSLHNLRPSINNAVLELERWTPQVNSAEGSNSFSAN